MELDIKKICKTPKTQWEALNLLNESNQRLLDAIHMMNSVIINNTDEFKEIHEKRIRAFIKQFEKL